MSSPFQGIPVPPRAMRKRTRRTRITARGLVTDYVTLETTDFSRGVEDVEVRSNPPLACGHIVKHKAYPATCSVCRATEGCESCQLQCGRCRRILFYCCAELYRADDGSETHYCAPCHKVLRRRRLTAWIGDALKHPFIAEQPEES